MNVFRGKESIAVHVLICPKIHLIVLLCAGLSVIIGLMLVALASFLVAQAWSRVESTLVDVSLAAYKAARWLQLVADLLVVLTSFVTQSLLLAALEQYAQDFTAWFLLFTFACELAKSGYESLKNLWLGTRQRRSRQ